MSQIGIFKTNQSCGFHINVSCPTIFVKGTHDYRYFFCKFIQFFNENIVLKQYQRDNNHFCLPYIGRNKRTFGNVVKRYFELMNKSSLLDSFPNEVCTTDKYRTVAYRDSNNGRIEIRAVGNTDYQIHTEKLVKTLMHIKECFDRAYLETCKLQHVGLLHDILHYSTEAEAITAINKHQIFSHYETLHNENGMKRTGRF